MKTYGEYLSEIFHGQKVQKISVDAGFTCPNRDGTRGSGGCIYCRNDSFSPSYCDSKESISNQISRGKAFFARKYPEMKFLAYFQSYTGTYLNDVSKLELLYREALKDDKVVGLVVATRPDSISDEALNLLADINCEKPVFIELGAETSNDTTLRLINRNHTWSDVIDATTRIGSKDLHCGIHLICGLPGEGEKEILQTVADTIKLPIETIKLHQLQVLLDTPLHNKMIAGEISVPNFTLEEYLQLCVKIVRMVPSHIVIERFLSQSPPEMVVSPSWGLKNYEFMAKLEHLLS